MEKIRDYLTAGTFALSILISPLISYAHSTPRLPKLPKFNINPASTRKINYEEIYSLPLEYNLDAPEIPIRLLKKSELIAKF